MRIFVGSLPYSTTKEELNEMFSQHGTVTSADIVEDRESRESKGFGFVEMPDVDEANKAIAALNGTPVGKRNIVVNEARPREERPSGGNFGGGNRRY